MKNLTPVLALEYILMTMGVFTLIKWVVWNIIDQTEIVETVGTFIGNSKHDKNYYFGRYVKGFNNIKIIITMIWIVLLIANLLFLGMRVIR